jgi:hypothetical protein
VLTNVVELTDLDPLLDPPAKPVTGVPFDANPSEFPASVPSAPPIPPAAEGPAIAPMPREAKATDPIRSFWYGDHRLPRQIGGGLSEPELLHEIREFHERNRPQWGGRQIGIGYFF